MAIDIIFRVDGDMYFNNVEGATYYALYLSQQRSGDDVPVSRGVKYTNSVDWSWGAPSYTTSPPGDQKIISMDGDEDED
jgi:hypothetical protein